MIHYYGGQSTEVCAIVDDAVPATASGLHTGEQAYAWAPDVRDYASREWRCDRERPFLLVSDGTVAGLIACDEAGHIGCLCMRPAYHRRGIGSAVLTHVIGFALKREISRVFAEASHAAKGLFEKHGLRTVREYDVVCRGIPMSTWIRERALP
jgi:ribosomal protein S18 acetylase RimI-like enzyme